MVFMVVSTPSTPTTVVIPKGTISLMKNSGVWLAKPFSPLPPSRCWWGSMNPGTTRHPAASTTSCSTPSASTARRSTSPTLAILPSVRRMDRFPAGSGV